MTATLADIVRSFSSDFQRFDASDLGLAATFLAVFGCLVIRVVWP